MRILTNISSLQAQRALSATQKALARSLERLSSGSRINSARDDAAGLAIATGLSAQVRALNQAVRNVNDAKGFLSTADSAVATQSELLQRMRELAVQSANGTLGSQDRKYLNAEFSALLAEVDRVANQTNFNGANLLDGSFNDLEIQTSTTKQAGVKIQIGSTRVDDLFKRIVGTGQFMISATNPVADATSLYGARLGSFDVDGDGNLDVVSAPINGSNVNVFKGRGDGTFKAVVSSNLSFSSQYQTFNDADIDGDGKKELLMGGGKTNFVHALKLNNNGMVIADQAIDVGSNNTDAPEVADLNGDGINDLVASTDAGGSAFAVVRLGLGGGNFAPAQTLALGAGSYPGKILVFDVNRDGVPDIVGNSNGTNHFYTYFGKGDGTFQTAVTSVGLNINSMTTGDFNRDGIPDIAGSNSGSVTAYLGDGRGGFNASAPAPNFGFAGNIVSADFNSDGALDVASSLDGVIQYAFGNGDGTFKSAITMRFGQAASGGDFGAGVTSGDFNKDGLPDLAIAGYNPSGAMVLLNGTQQVSAVPQLNLLSQSSSADALGYLDSAAKVLLSTRANIGASLNRLDSVANVSSITAENLSAAKSQIADTDVAAETAELTRAQILQQAGIAVLGQANSNIQIALQLLKF